MARTTPTRRSWLRKALAILVRILLVLGVLLAGAGACGYYWLERNILSTLPDDLTELETWRGLTVCRVYDAEGSQIDEFYVERRIWVDVETLPPHVWQAFVAAEDHRFFEHPGVDAMGIARAMVENLRAGEITQGGSTITQQLVKNLVVGDEKSYERKLKEAVLAFRLERELDKMSILELYMNHVFLGAGNYGVEAAAQDYYGVSASMLGPEQAALIAGLIPAPSRYNPRRSPDEARWRRAIVLREMVEAGYLDPIDAIDHLSAPVLARVVRDDDYGVAAAYVTHVRREVRRLMGDRAPFEEGITVHTPYDHDLQIVAQAAVRRAILAHEERQGKGTPDEPWAEGAAVVLENETGRVLAMVGGWDVGLEGFVRATQARRQPGSSFKAYVYALALREGMTQLDIVNDAPLALPAGGGRLWSPRNYSGGFQGRLPMRKALAKSLNTVSVRLALEHGPAEIGRLARAMGVRTPIRNDLTIALGSSEVTPLDQAVGYATIARLGVPVEPVFIDLLEDVRGREVGRRGGPIVVDGQVLATLPGAPLPRALPAGPAYELLDMLQEVVISGTARRAFDPRHARAGKTGTTNDYVDAWFVGMTPRHTVAVWIGSDTTGSLGEAETGGRAALPAWLEIVEALPREEGERFPVPDEAILIRAEDRFVGVTRGRVPRSRLPWTDVGEAPLPVFPAPR